MTAQRLAELGEAIWGRWGWQTRLSEELGVRDSTVRKYKSGRLRVPGHVAAFVRERFARVSGEALRPDRAKRGRMFRRGDELVIRFEDGLDGLNVTLEPKAVEVEAVGGTLVLRRRGDGPKPGAQSSAKARDSATAG